MAEARRVNDHDCDSTVNGFSLFKCCCCHGSMHDPIQLNCLHYYCRSCFHTNKSNMQVIKSTVTCPACAVVTKVRSVRTNNFLSTYKRASSLRAEFVWCTTCEKEGKEESAEFWCVTCAEALCATCCTQHKKVCDGHRIFELEYARTLPLSQLTQAAQCNVHHLRIEVHCFTCCWPKCTKCLEGCTVGSHVLHLLSDDKVQMNLFSVTTRVRETTERLSSLLSNVLQKCRAFASRLPVDRINGHRMLVDHRRQLHNSTLRAFDESADELCSSLESTRFERPDIVARGVPRICAANVEALAVTGIRGLRLLGARNVLKTVAASCRSSVRASNRRLLQRSGESGSISIIEPRSLTSGILLSACLGSTNRQRAALSAPLHFNEDPLIFEVPFNCYDLAVTRHGHVLLAAGDEGLLLYSDCGDYLSGWPLEKWPFCEDYQIMSVVALSDGRVVVDMGTVQLVLLSHSQKGDLWVEHRRLSVLQSRPWHMAAHDDLLAVAEARQDDQGLGAGREVKLLRLSSGHLLYTLRSTDYDVASVALSAQCLLTAMLDPAKRGSGESPNRVDAFSHTGELLWRHETGNEEFVAGLCVSTDTWSSVYLALGSDDGNGTRVIAIGGADGKDCREVLSGWTHGLENPVRLSLARGQGKTILAVLSLDDPSPEAKLVFLYEATS